MSLFYDSSFPPDSSSIDGRCRPQTSISTSSSSTSSSFLCLCNEKPRIRQVYKDGPNQGRYFYACAEKLCNYFKWDDGLDQPSGSNRFKSSSAGTHSWKYFRKEDGWYMVGKKGFLSEHILQGSIGDCWFLSALAVIAERPDLIEAIVITRPHLSDDGKSTFRLFVDGDWKLVDVDNQLPYKTKKAVGHKRKVGIKEEDTLVFAKSFQNFLWVPLLEKAYAKIHGNIYIS